MLDISSFSPIMPKVVKLVMLRRDLTTKGWEMAGTTWTPHNSNLPWILVLMVGMTEQIEGRICHL